MEENLPLQQVYTNRSPTAVSLHRIHILRMILWYLWTAMGLSNMTVAVLDALHMDTMMSDIDSWRRDPESYLRQRGLKPESPSVGEEVYVLIVEGFLIFNHRPLNELFCKRYFMEIPYDVCKMRRSMRVYTPPDPPGYFDGYVWPKYLRNRQEMESMVSGIVYLDGLKPKEELLAAVCNNVSQEIESLQEKD
ncbi:nicotinamide riboside kinase 1 isoform X2 [Epinephelus fuscoguttatus]|uniref:nicotinamide riboside kinase 1 isoform X2 n=1 Tax=Epinephelus fuscoguttatus TaxID=293821 RepID=UPI0020D16293|nr:nicotinamide riboside kinase 1 isoform X2 [Epinephelus fuscoguttatus]